MLSNKINSFVPPAETCRMATQCLDYTAYMFSEMGVGPNLLALAIHGLVASILLVLVDMGVFTNLWHNLACIGIGFHRDSRGSGKSTQSETVVHCSRHGDRPQCSVCLCSFFFRLVHSKGCHRGFSVLSSPYSFVTSDPAMSSLAASIHLISRLPRFIFPGSFSLSIFSQYTHHISSVHVQPSQPCLFLSVVTVSSRSVGPLLMASETKTETARGQFVSGTITGYGYVQC